MRIFRWIVERDNTTKSTLTHVYTTAEVLMSRASPYISFDEADQAFAVRLSLERRRANLERQSARLEAIFGTLRC